MASQAAGDSVSFGNVSGGKVIGAGGGPGSIIGETVEVNGPVIHIHNLTAEGARTLRGILRISPEVAAGSAPAAPTGETGTLVRAGIDDMLRLMKSYAQRGLSALQLEAGTAQFSAVDLLLRKAVLLVSEANALTVAASTPEKAEVARRMDQAALGEMLAGFDGEAARARLAEALGVLHEARELAPDSTAVMLQTAQVLGRLNTGATREERDLLDEVLRRVGTPWTDEQRLHRAQAMYLLGTLGRNRDVDLLREAREQFVRLGRVDWMRQCDQMLAAAQSLPGRRRKPARPSRPLSVGRVARRLGYALVALLFLWVGGFALRILLALAAANAATGTVSTGIGSTAALVQPASTPPSAASFDPAGRWEVVWADGHGPTFSMELVPGGGIQGTTFIPNAGQVKLAGRWTYDATQRIYTLNLDGNGETMGSMQYQVTQLVDGGFIGVAADGSTYRFTRR